jgi:hypothetical protein
MNFESKNLFTIFAIIAIATAPESTTKTSEVYENALPCPPLDNLDLSLGNDSNCLSMDNLDIPDDDILSSLNSICQNLLISTVNFPSIKEALKAIDEVDLLHSNVKSDFKLVLKTQASKCKKEIDVYLNSFKDRKINLENAVKRFIEYVEKEFEMKKKLDFSAITDSFFYRILKNSKFYRNNCEAFGKEIDSNFGKIIRFIQPENFKTFSDLILTPLPYLQDVYDKLLKSSSTETLLPPEQLSRLATRLQAIIPIVSEPMDIEEIKKIAKEYIKRVYTVQRMKPGEYGSEQQQQHLQSELFIYTKIIQAFMQALLEKKSFNEILQLLENYSLNLVSFSENTFISEFFASYIKKENPLEMQNSNNIEIITAMMDLNALSQTLTSQPWPIETLKRIVKNFGMFSKLSYNSLNIIGFFNDVASRSLLVKEKSFPMIKFMFSRYYQFAIDHQSRGFDYQNFDVNFDLFLIDNFQKSTNTLVRFSLVMMRFDVYMISPRQNKSVYIKLEKEFIEDLRKADFGPDYDFVYDFLFLPVKLVYPAFRYEVTDIIETEDYDHHRYVFQSSPGSIIPSNLLKIDGRRRLMNALFEAFGKGIQFVTQPVANTLI